MKQQPENRDLLAFVGKLMRLEAYEIEGDELQELLLAHGFLEEVPATAEDAEQDWAKEYDIEEGDLCYKTSELGKLALAAACDHSK